MNERIRELAGNALDEAIPETWTTLTAYDLNKFAEKFAELIVQECLLALEPNLYESDIEYRVDQAFYKKCEHIIINHFRIKE